MNQFKFKNFNSNSLQKSNKEKWNNEYCNVIDSRGDPNEEGVNKVTERLDAIESLLNKYLPVLIKSISDANIDNSPIGLSSPEATISARPAAFESTKNNNINRGKVIESSSITSKLLTNEDYTKEIIRFYFTVKSYCAYPPIIDLEEFYQGLRVKLPDYLFSAILSHGCLNSPHPNLYCKNFSYSNYYYILAINQLNPNLSSPNIYMIQTLLILSGVDEACNRAYQKIDRITTAVRLAQILKIERIEEFEQGFLPPELTNVPVYTIKKVWLLLKHWDEQTSSLMDAPLMIKSGIKYADFLSNKSFINAPSIKECKSTLPKAYLDFFQANLTFAKIVLPWFDELEQGLENETANIKLEKCYEILNCCKNWRKGLKPSVKFDPSCFDQVKILQNPLFRLRGSLNQKFLEILLQIYEYSFKLINQLGILKAFGLIQNFIQFSKEFDDLLEIQQFQLLKSEIKSNNNTQASKPKIYLNLSIFSALGKLYLNSIQFLDLINLDFANNTTAASKKKFKNFENLLNSRFSNLIQNLENLKDDWEGCELILKNLSRRYDNFRVIREESSVLNPIIQSTKH